MRRVWQFFSLVERQKTGTTMRSTRTVNNRRRINEIYVGGIVSVKKVSQAFVEDAPESSNRLHPQHFLFYRT